MLSGDVARLAWIDFQIVDPNQWRGARFRHFGAGGPP
jgi:hypothetical protein